MQYYSQIGQDKYVNERIFRGMENGFFVDIGAHDGISYSNSYFFEKHKNWKGICVEPLPEVYQLLRKNRECICIEGAIFFEDGYQDFLRVQGPTNTEMLSGLVNEYDSRHKNRIDIEIQGSNGSSEVIKVKTFPLQSILDTHNVTHIDFCSIDTEGSELGVLQSIDFKKVKIECITVENNYQTKNVEEYLTMQGYRLVEKLEYDDIFLHSQSKFSIL
ncbi:methyltransferase, FkbM family [Bacillus sp. 71mf]|uniref:FkbM family methyltransferase n=2 Tax=unclassified Bacillus (in: firmicutes) TaxID=185979 RepID=UPI0008E693A8|nr:FkbM family methyltransferase [Bacillus sp. 103mf]SFI88951.1 methyltransferase, FkbM family [Bacillus sp. 71mf]SFS66935.1 methyltransferase, FkbM family [Bacillus sp. 103mf]